MGNVQHDASLVSALARETMEGKLTRREAILRGAALGLGTAGLVALNGATSVFAQDATPASAGDTPLDPNAKSGGILKVGLQADPAELDPHKTNLTAAWHIIEHVYDGLVGVDASLAPTPALATDWTISDDGLTYTFNLRQGVTFHNGRALTSDDVKYSFERIVDEATASPNASDFSVISAIDASDPAVVVITLASADASFIAKLMGNAGKIVAKEVVEENGDLNQTMVGTGPFKFVDYVPNSTVTLEKNAEFWLEGRPYLDGIEFQIVPESTSRTAALVSNTVDFIEYAPVQDIPTFEANSELVVAGDANTNIRYVALNVSNEPLDKLEVRQAIAKVVDRGPIIDSSVFGYGTPMQYIFPESYWAGLGGEIPAADVDGAKALLESVGLADGFKLRCTSWASYPFLSNAAIVLQEQLKAINIEVELDLQENAIYLEGYFGGDFDLSVTGTSAYVDPNDVLASNFLSDGDANGIGYNNPEVDELIKAGVAETDQEARAAIYRQVQEILLTDLPWINLFVANQYEVYKSYVQGYVHIATGTNASFRDVWLDQ